MHDLLENGAPVATKDPKDNTPLHITTRKGEAETAQLFESADIDTVVNKGITPLLTAIDFVWSCGDSKSSICCGSGCQFGRRRQYRESVVHIAAQRGNVDILRAAIEHGPDVNHVTTKSALHPFICSCCRILPPIRGNQRTR